jgi:integrase
MSDKITTSARLSGRVIGKGYKTMARPKHQTGSLLVRGKRKKMYVARYYENVTGPDGKMEHVRRSVLLGPVAEIGTRRVALNRMTELLRPINLGWQAPKATITFRQFVRNEWEPKVFCLFKPSTQVGYCPILSTHLLPHFGENVLFEITPAQVQGFLSDKSKTGIAWNTLRNLRNLLRSILRTASEWGYIEDNPVARVKLPPRPRRTVNQFLSPEQVRKLIAQMREPYRSMALLAVLTGLRRGELFALRWGDVNLEKGTLEVRESVYNGHFSTPKTHSSVRRIPLSSPAVALLRTQKLRAKLSGVENLVFASRAGTPLRPDNILKRVIHPLCDKLKLPHAGWHMFRHLHATLLSELGESLKTSQAILGHSDMQTTLQVYTHAVSESLMRAEERLAGLVLDPNGPKLSPGKETETEEIAWIQ